ncbi:MAG: glycosyltransferase family 4 protein [Terriglobales bacterium]
MSVAAGPLARANWPPAELVINTRVMTLPMTGVQRYVQEILPVFGEDIRVLQPRLPCRGLAGHAWEQMVLPARCRGAVLFSPSNTGPLAVARQVVTIHDVVPLDHPEWLNPRFAAWYRYLIPRLVLRARRVIAISEFTKSRLLATTGVRPERVAVIHHGLDPRFAPQPELAVAAVRARLGLRGPYLLALGSLEPRKNLTGLLRAWAALPEIERGANRLVLAGGAGHSAVFAPAPLELPEGATWIGHVADELLPALYSGATAFAYLSFYEGFGKPPLEAMACGTPVLTSGAGALAEVAGGAALTADPHDSAAIAQALRRLLADAALRGELRELGLRQAAQFTWATAGRRTLETLRAAF